MIMKCLRGSFHAIIIIICYLVHHYSIVTIVLVLVLFGIGCKKYFL